MELHENNGGIDTWCPRYILDTACHYSRLKIPVPAPEYDVPIRPGFFTASTAWPTSSYLGQIKISRQLVLLDYSKDKKKAVGRYITVLF